MRWLLFLSRLAFICNVVFLVAGSLQLTKWFQNQDAEALVITIGFFMAMLINPFTNLCYLIVFLLNKRRLVIVPLWLRIANFLFLGLQIFYIFHLNAK